MKDLKEIIKQEDYIHMFNLLYNLSLSEEEREKLGKILVDKVEKDKSKYMQILLKMIFSNNLRNYAGIKLINLCSSLEEIKEISKNNSFPLQIREKAIQKIKKLFEQMIEEKSPYVKEVCEKIIEAYLTIRRNLTHIMYSLTNIVNAIKFNRSKISYQDIKEIINFYNLVFEDIINNEKHPFYLKVIGIRDLIFFYKKSKGEVFEKNFKNVKSFKNPPDFHPKTHKIT